LPPGALPKALAVAVGAYHGFGGVLGLFLYRTGPEPWTVLVMSFALVSTPLALVLAAWGGRRVAAAWLALAALAYAVSGDRGAWSEWAYAGLFYGPQLIAALVLLRRRTGTDRPVAAMNAGNSPAMTKGRAWGWGFALVVGLCHASVGLWLVLMLDLMLDLKDGLAPGWWIAAIVSLLSTLPAVMLARNTPRLGGGWLAAAAYLGAFATARAGHLDSAAWAFTFILFWLPQALLGILFLRSRPKVHGRLPAPPSLSSSEMSAEVNRH